MYGQQATANLLEHCEGASKFNKRVEWKTANIDNAHFTSEYTYLFETFSTVLQADFAILNNNGENHSENQIVSKMLEKIKVPNN